jgi:hypothetical protein
MLRKTPPVVHEQDARVVAQIRSNPEWTVLRLLSPLWLADRHVWNFTLFVEGFQVSMQVTRLPPFARSFVRLAGQLQSRNIVLCGVRIAMDVWRVKVQTNFNVAARIEVGEILGNAKATQTRPRFPQNEVYSTQQRRFAGAIRPDEGSKTVKRHVHVGEAPVVTHAHAGEAGRALGYFWF